MLDVNANAIRDVKVLLKTAPFLPNDQTLGMGTKTGGRIAIGKDGFLMSPSATATMPAPGPGAWRRSTIPIWARSCASPRIGAPAPGNPFIGVGGALPEIWAIGFRSQDGLGLRRQRHTVETEHGRAAATS